MCRVHGGSAPQVLDKARRRILEAIDPLLAKVIEKAMAKDASPEYQHSVFKTLLDKADKYSPPPLVPGEAPPDTGTTWEEFLRIYRPKRETEE